MQTTVSPYVPIKIAANVLRAVNHPLRQRMIDKIKDKGQATVTELFIAFKLEQSVCSQHLGILRKVGVFNATEVGKYRYYSVNEQRLQQIIKLSKALTEFS